MENANISLIASIVSLVLAVVAIWLALHLKKESDVINSETKKLLLDIHSDAKIISKVAMPELKAYGEEMRNYVFRVKDGSQVVQESNTIIEDAKAEIVELREKNIISTELANSINQIEKRLIESQQIISKRNELYGEDSLIIDLSNFQYDELSAEMNQFNHVQDLLDSLYYNFLKDSVDPYTYNTQWIIEDVDAEIKISSLGKNDYRTLPEAGFIAGVTYRARTV